MNINIGAPYEAAIRRIIEKGYGGNQTEVIRQAIFAYERMIEEQELVLVHQAVEVEIREMETDETTSLTFDQIKRAIAE